MQTKPGPRRNLAPTKSFVHYFCAVTDNSSCMHGQGTRSSLGYLVDQMDSPSDAVKQSTEPHRHFFNRKTFALMDSPSTPSYSLYKKTLSSPEKGVLVHIETPSPYKLNSLSSPEKGVLVHIETDSLYEPTLCRVFFAKRRRTVHQILSDSLWDLEGYSVGTYRTVHPSSPTPTLHLA